MKKIIRCLSVCLIFFVSVHAQILRSPAEISFAAKHIELLSLELADII